MRKEFLFVLVLFVFSTVISVNQAQAQDTPKVEIGAQYSFFKTDGGIGGGKANGVGGIMAINFSEFIGADFALFRFPNQDILGIDSTDATQGFFGVKTGMRSEKAGVFGKFRPGFIRQSSGGFASETNFALDIGGVLELYPSRNVGLRFDIGDTIVRTPLGGGVTVNTNNFQIAAGVMFRF